MIQILQSQIISADSGLLVRERAIPLGVAGRKKWAQFTEFYHFDKIFFANDEKVEDNTVNTDHDAGEDIDDDNDNSDGENNEEETIV